MKFKEHFHRNAGTIIKHTESYNEEYVSLKETISSISDVDLIEKFNEVRETQPTKKSLSVPINMILKEKLVEIGWEPEVKIFRDENYTAGREKIWLLDFAKEKISVEVGFNHGGSIAHNLIKPTLAGELNHVQKDIQTEVAVLISATRNLKKDGNFDNAIGTYEKILTYLMPYNQYLTIPLAIIGLEAPETFKIGEDKEVHHLT